MLALVVMPRRPRRYAVGLTLAGSAIGLTLAGSAIGLTLAGLAVGPTG